MPRKRKKQNNFGLNFDGFEVDSTFSLLNSFDNSLDNERKKTRKVRKRRKQFLSDRVNHLNSGGEPLTPSEEENFNQRRNLIGGVNV